MVLIFQMVVLRVYNFKLLVFSSARIARSSVCISFQCPSFLQALPLPWIFGNNYPLFLICFILIVKKKQFQNFPKDLGTENLPLSLAVTCCRVHRFSPMEPTSIETVKPINLSFLSERKINPEDDDARERERERERDLGPRSEYFGVSTNHP